MREDQYLHAATGETAQDTNVISNPEPVDRDKHWRERALNVRKQVRVIDTHPRPFRLLHCPSGRAFGLNGRRLVVRGGISIGDGERWEGRFVQ